MNAADDRQMPEARRRAMSAFAVASQALLQAGWSGLGRNVEATAIRGPEIGLVMLRGRIGGGGGPFNLGEASVTRASVKLASGEIGHAMILGRAPEKARLAALLDAAWQRPDWRDRVETEIVTPALAAEAAVERVQGQEAEATRVDFFTMVRGED